MWRKHVFIFCWRKLNIKPEKTNNFTHSLTSPRVMLLNSFLVGECANTTAAPLSMKTRHLQRATRAGISHQLWEMTRLGSINNLCVKMEAGAQRLCERERTSAGVLKVLPLARLEGWHSWAWLRRAMFPRMWLRQQLCVFVPWLLTFKVTLVFSPNFVFIFHHCSSLWSLCWLHLHLINTFSELTGWL